jgi:hypothetical protein
MDWLERDYSSSFDHILSNSDRVLTKTDSRQPWSRKARHQTPDTMAESDKSRRTTNTTVNARQPKPTEGKPRKTDFPPRGTNGCGDFSPLIRPHDADDLSVFSSDSARLSRNLIFDRLSLASGVSSNCIRVVCLLDVSEARDKARPH